MSWYLFRAVVPRHTQSATPSITQNSLHPWHLLLKPLPLIKILYILMIDIL